MDKEIKNEDRSEEKRTRLADMDAMSAAHVQTVTVLCVAFAAVLIVALLVVALSIRAARDANRELAETTREWVQAWTEYDYASEDVTTIFSQDGEGVNIIGDGNEVGE